MSPEKASSERFIQPRELGAAALDASVWSDLEVLPAPVEELPAEERAPLVFDDSEEPESRYTAIHLSDDQVGDYLRQTYRYPLLDAGQETELAEAVEIGLLAEERLKGLAEDPEQARDLAYLMRVGEQAREQMILANLRLVISIAKRRQDRGLDFMELIQEGNIGLEHAVRMFDYRRGLKFSTYATYWINQAIGRAIDKQSQVVRVPGYTHDQIIQLYHATDRLSVELGHQATDQELASDLGVTADRVRELRGYGQPTLSLDAPVGDSEGHGAFSERLVENDEIGPEEIVVRSQVDTYIWRGLERLPDLERQVVILSNGLDGRPAITFAQIARQLDITVGRVWGASKRGMRQLRDDPDLAQLHKDQSI